MKKFLFFLMATLLFASAEAQTRDKVVVKTNAFKLFDYGRMASVTTIGATTTNVDSIAIAADEAGIIEVQVVGFNDSTNTAVTGSRIVRYVKAAGTITFGTASTPLATLTDTELSGATFTTAASATGNNIVVTVTGKAAYAIKWKANTRRISVTP